ncbi:MAG: tRNA pseudouridine(38-40) synthase TruA [Saprospiraceae bacterium]|nr:tRNA pseudouridine(38-40) synthase TruA [Saprospiraceae bacterium]
MRYFIRLSYCGTHYNGWQNQKPGKGISVQKTIQDAISTLLRKETIITGCGRTDAGVHASDYKAHFDFEPEITNESFIHKLNKLLPPDIVVQALQEMPEGAHARFDAISRSYVYHMHTTKSAFRPFSFFYKYTKPDFIKLKAAAAIISDYNDFTTFCKTRTDTKTNLCRISESKWLQTSEHTWEYHITADRFLRGMVRLIVGMCLNVCREKLTIDDVKKALECKTRTGHDWSVPAEGLFLSDVAYPEELKMK